jgi:hypothetical protein
VILGVVADLEAARASGGARPSATLGLPLTKNVPASGRGCVFEGGDDPDGRVGLDVPVGVEEQLPFVESS